MNDLQLVPCPQQIKLTGGMLDLPERRFIVIDHTDASALTFTAQLLKNGLVRYGELDWGISASPAVPADRTGVTLNIEERLQTNPQAYKLSVTAEGIIITSSSSFGIFYGVLTLLQLLEQHGRNLPLLLIEDYPDFTHRGVLLDISRDKVPSMETLTYLIDLFASWKINQLQLYTEHTFAYQSHETVWKDASPLTGEEILQLDAYCRERFIELVPNQNCFGHMNRWLKHEKYLSLAEAPKGFKHLGQIPMGAECLDPSDPGSLKLIEGLLDELLPHFSSSQINVNLDEAFELGEGKSREKVAELGKGRVFLDYLLKIHQAVVRQGKTMMFWGDMLTAYPDLIAQLPKDIIALEWGYEADHPFSSRCRVLTENGVPFYVCPGTSSWCSISGRIDNALENIRNAAEAGLENGAIGLLNTDWGDHGHWQTLPISMPGFIYGAAVSWSLSANKNLDLASAISRLAFGDDKSKIGKLIMELGRVHQKTGAEAINGTVLFNLLQTSLKESLEILGSDDTGLKISDIRAFMYADQEQPGDNSPGEAEIPREVILHAYKGDLHKLTRSDLDELLIELERIEAAVEQIDISNGSDNLVKQELYCTIAFLKHACLRWEWVLNHRQGEVDNQQTEELIKDIDKLIASHSQVWSRRNRIGGLRESVGRLEKLRDEYLNPPISKG